MSSIRHIQIYSDPSNLIYYHYYLPFSTQCILNKAAQHPNLYSRVSHINHSDNRELLRQEIVYSIFILYIFLKTKPLK